MEKKKKNIALSLAEFFEFKKLKNEIFGGYSFVIVTDADLKTKTSKRYDELLTRVLKCRETGISIVHGLPANIRL